ncbi:uncharacterized protein LOC118459870 isoform X1 [Anopheles albimanus]|uniref:uncharacterized protein LOC118459870 isoform X1 n=1 Tax=Anopheles albimanus TaxID=7167 RepID=UPI00163E3154|nr:uncharacterized protein LOC118459870 isoform X1 [Anopheles albimanus]XP_035779549.1 uncharacterized protein LOC118459870 isoform X1 [Anopheles albimanus]
MSSEAAKPAAAPKLSVISAKFTEATLDEIVQKVGGKRCTSWKMSDTEFKKGDSYLSELYRIQLCDDSGDQPLVVNAVVKTIPKNVGRRNTFRSADFFRNEYNFYTVVLKELYSFQSKRQPKHPFDDIPKCLAAYSDGENDFIALEDQSQYGYGTASRSTAITLEEGIRCMHTLGRLHALSLAMKDQEPELLQQVTSTIVETYYSADREPWYRNFMLRLIPISKHALGVVCAEEQQKYPSNDEFQCAVERFLDSNIYQMMIEMTHTHNRNSVINHGDCWLPNFLFHQDSSVRIIDFQMVRYASPVLDIILFVYTCTDQELRKTHYDALLQAYHMSCCELLHELGSNPAVVFPRTELVNELEQFGRFGCAVAMESIPLSLLEDAEVADLNSIEGTEAVPLEEVLVLANISSSEGRRRLVDVYRHAYECGYLK